MKTNGNKFERAIIIGTSTIAIHCAKKLTSIGLPVEVIEYQRAEISPLSRLCAKENIPFAKLNKKEITDYFLDVQEECLVVSAFNIYLFPSSVIKKPNIEIINYHNALLPKYAGRNAEAWAIFMQENETGITWHYVNETVDNGNIVCQKAISLPDDITSMKLLKQQHILAIAALDEILPGVLSGLHGKRQNPPDPRNLYYAKSIPGGGLLDTDWTADKIYAFLRAMDYGPLNTLGKPILIHNGKRYAWKKYEHKKNDENHRRNQIIVKDDCIEIKCDGADILLHKPQVADM